MSLIHLVIVLAIVGVILWAINSYIPMQSTIKKILNVVVVVAVVVWLLSVFGVSETSRQFVSGNQTSNERQEEHREIKHNRQSRRQDAPIER
jgi:hypothetical protein